jgi:guanylate kinase
MSLESLILPKNDPKPLLFVISGLSGSGKDTVLQGLKERNLPFHFVVTTTTRPKRTEEVEGRDYYFVTPDEFDRMVNDGEMLEHAHVYESMKGIPKKQVVDALASGKDVVMRLDVQGASTIRSLFADAILVFITPRSKEEWYRQLTDRNSETEETMRVRIDTAIQEVDYLKIFDYVVVNARDHLDEAVETIIAIIRAEHHRNRTREATL